MSGTGSPEKENPEEKVECRDINGCSEQCNKDAEKKKEKAEGIINSISTLAKSIAPAIIDFTDSIKNRKK